jgi:hypothetical protein
VTPVLFQIFTNKMVFLSQALVADASNPNYSGGRDQEDQGSQPAPANTSKDPISKKALHKNRASGVKVKVLSSRPSTTKRKER